MKKFFFLGLVISAGLLLMFSGYSSSAKISLSVEENMSSEMLITDYNFSQGSPKTLEMETSNRGSLPFLGQLRLDVFDGDQRVMRTWSRESVIEPGSIKHERFVFFRPNLKGELKATVTFHHGASDTTEKEINLTTQTVNVSEGFDLTKTRTYEDEIRLAIDCPQETGELYVTILDEARRFEQETGSCENGEEFLNVNYGPEIKDNEEVKLIIGESEGRYYYTRNLDLERITGWKAALIRFYDSSIEIFI